MKIDLERGPKPRMLLKRFPAQKNRLRVVLPRGQHIKANAAVVQWVRLHPKLSSELGSIVHVVLVL